MSPDGLIFQLLYMMGFGHRNNAGQGLFSEREK
jgi:hypothetical protein